MSKEKSPKKESKKLSKEDKKIEEQKLIKKLIKIEKYKALGYNKTKEKYED